MQIFDPGKRIARGTGSAMGTGRGQARGRDRSTIFLASGADSFGHGQRLFVNDGNTASL